MESGGELCKAIAGVVETSLCHRHSGEHNSAKTAHLRSGRQFYIIMVCKLRFGRTTDCIKMWRARGNGAFCDHRRACAATEATKTQETADLYSYYF